MGNLCSRSGTHEGGHTVLSSPATTTGGAAPPPGQDRRAAAAEAAERRIQTAQRRGVNTSNPKAGQLAAKVAQPTSKDPADPPDQRLVWD